MLFNQWNQNHTPPFSVSVIIPPSNPNHRIWCNSFFLLILHNLTKCWGVRPPKSLNSVGWFSPEQSQCFFFFFLALLLAPGFPAINITPMTLSMQTFWNAKSIKLHVYFSSFKRTNWVLLVSPWALATNAELPVLTASPLTTLALQPKLYQTEMHPTNPDMPVILEWVLWVSENAALLNICRSTHPPHFIQLELHPVQRRLSTISRCSSSKLIEPILGPASR